LGPRARNQVRAIRSRKRGNCHTSSATTTTTAEALTFSGSVYLVRRVSAEQWTGIWPRELTIGMLFVILAGVYSAPFNRQNHGEPNVAFVRR